MFLTQTLFSQLKHEKRKSESFELGKDNRKKNLLLLL